MRILLAEDDQHLGKAIVAALKEQNPHYIIEWVTDGLKAKAFLTNKNEPFDLAILDINMPILCGFQVLKNIRKNKNNTPVFFLTARNQIDDKVKGLDLGADDYIVKPFDLQELQARIRAIQRRSLQKNSNVMKFKNIEIDLKTHTVKINNDIVFFSKIEYRILARLIKTPNNIVSKNNILQSTYEHEHHIESNSFEVHIHNIRKKLPKEIKIQSARGIGYMITEAI